jgi:uncharacterized protein
MVEKSMSSFNIKELEACFKLPAIKSSFDGLYESLGLITAVASSPEKIEPAEWIEQIKTVPGPVAAFDSDAQLRAFTKNLVAWWNYCTTFFDHGHQLELPQKLQLTATGKANKALVEFSTGYLKGYDWLSTTWQALLPEKDSEAARSVMLLNLILARFINEKAVAKTEPEIFEQLPDIVGCFKSLPSLLSAVGMLGIDLANQNQNDERNSMVKTPSINKLRDIGRNDPCPCGSGKKFKKCCLH